MKGDTRAVMRELSAAPNAFKARQRWANAALPPLPASPWNLSNPGSHRLPGRAAADVSLSAFLRPGKRGHRELRWFPADRSLTHCGAAARGGHPPPLGAAPIPRPGFQRGGSQIRALKGGGESVIAVCCRRNDGQSNPLERGKATPSAPFSAPVPKFSCNFCFSSFLCSRASSPF